MPEHRYQPRHEKQESRTLILQRLTIRSGGQAGADLAALQWAVENGIPHCGWCPKGRQSEAGPIDQRFNLTETPSTDYRQRTEWNVRDSDATVIFTVKDRLTGGSKLTAEFAKKHRKPWLHLAAERSGEDPAPRLQAFVDHYQVGVLNVAGSRGSNEPDVGKFVHEVMSGALEILPKQ